MGCQNGLGEGSESGIDCYPGDERGSGDVVVRK